MARQRAKAQSKSTFYGGAHVVHTTHLPQSYLPYVRPTHKLRVMLISQMRLETHHRGQKVILRVLTPPHQMNAATVVVEDRAGTGAVLQLCHLLEESIIPAEGVVYEGRICVLKEPFFKAAVDGSYAPRIDHVNDIIWLLENDEQIPSIWRTNRRTTKDSSLALRTQGKSRQEEGVV